MDRNGAAKEEDGVARCEWDIVLSSVVSHGSCNIDPHSTTDALGVTEFDPTGRFIATGGIARKIRIYPTSPLLQSDVASPAVSLDLNYAGSNNYIFTPAKLSSLKWKPRSGLRVIGSGDYDGVVTEFDIETRTTVFERDEHGGKRVWSVDYSRHGNLGVSGSDDGSMQMWDTRSEEGARVAAVWPSRFHSATSSAVCSVEFEPVNGMMVAVGCADKRGYLFDVRMMSEPVFVMEGHSKTVTYVKFVDDSRVVTSAVDGQLRLWNVEGGVKTERIYAGHVNSRNFVGLSVWRQGGLVVSGSETNEVYVYDRRWGTPIWVHGRVGCNESENSIVCSVATCQILDDHCVLAAGGSDGVLQVFQAFRRTL